MSDKVALVTGGTRGIGASICTELQQAGFKVVANYCGNDVAAQNFTSTTGIQTFKWDVGDYAACQKGIEDIEQQVGPIQVLVNNAGITQDGMFHKMTYEQWHQVMTINMNSCFNMARLTINAMRERGWGRIINISSINGQKGQLGQVNYATAKAGIIGFTKALALENANKGITVNAIAPGYIETEMVSAIPQATLDRIVSHIPAGRLGTPHEIARAVRFLAHGDSGFITGITFSINGGQYMV